LEDPEEDGAADKDAKRMLKYRNWRRLAEDRDAWRRRIEEAKAQVGLQNKHKKKKRRRLQTIINKPQTKFSRY